MTRFIHDQFSKDFIESLLAPYGTVKAPTRVAAEVKLIDILFTPNVQQNPELEPLGLFGKFAEFPAIFEPFRNAVQEDDIPDCIIRVLEVEKALEREAKRKKTVISETAIPKQWILTPTVSDDVLSKCKADPDASWGKGVYFTAEILRTAIVAIHELDREPETLWLRMLGRDTVQKNAIDEFIALREDNVFKQATLESLYNFKQNLEFYKPEDTEETELIMRLAPLYQQDRELAKQEGRTEGRVEEGQRLVLRQLNRRFGEIDASIIEQIHLLSIEQLEALGEALLDFSALSDLEAWLNQELQ